MKKKIFKAAVCAGLGVCLTLTAAGCNKSSGLDPETRPLMLATAALDGNFNPFTYTSQTDGDILGLTQLGMFTNDNDGALICGQNEATVALNYAVTMYDAKKVGEGNVTTTGSEDGRTEYEIVIKNGIKFSDNIDLTIKDVLFNFYVYLDVAYTGSSTIYSTDIQGLNAYRAQDKTYTDETDADISESFTGPARQRVVNILNWIEDSDATELVPTNAEIKKDYDLALELFRKELTDDWTSLETGWKTSYEENYNFTAAWQAYLFQEGIAEVQTRLNTTTNGYEQIKINDKYVTTLEPTVEGCNNGAVNVGDIKLQAYIEGLEEATTDALVKERAQKDNCSEETALLRLQRDYCIDEVVFKYYTDKSELANVLQFWATASNLMEELTAQERTKYYENRPDSEKVDNVSGITTEKLTGAQLKAKGNWKMTGETFNDAESYDVLKIVINGIDPKAIYNFAFTVTPLHYYSGTWHGKDYVKAAMEDTENKEFGVQVGNSDFFKEVISSTDKNGVPVGAGTYMASTKNGGRATDGGEFNNDNIVYFERNPYFETVGTGIHNAIIKYIRYRVTPDDLIMSGLQTKTIDYGTPAAKTENINTVTAEKHLEAERYQAGGYGYVGINPKFVPELEVRQAIMKAMNTRSIIQDYYRGNLAVNIWRPMTKTSWAYPDPEPEEFEATKYTTDDDKIIELVEKAGYKKGTDGIYAKNGKKLKLTFTIAGDTKDHPARAMFEDAARTLNQLGFNITVSTSSQALKEMTRGNLAVWAAAWSSSIDPDPYQVYHKDSKATSVNNWNYAEILNENNHQFDRERIIVEELSDLIDQGRSVLEREDRIPIYAKCLDKIMELAVELPTYQRNELCVFNSKVLDRKTMTETPTSYNGLLSRIWELNYVK